jgi:hypothetical protein
LNFSTPSDRCSISLLISYPWRGRRSISDKISSSALPFFNSRSKSFTRICCIAIYSAHTAKRMSIVNPRAARAEPIAPTAERTERKIRPAVTLADFLHRSTASLTQADIGRYGHTAFANQVHNGQVSVPDLRSSTVRAESWARRNPRPTSTESIARSCALRRSSPLVFSSKSRSWSRVSQLQICIEAGEPQASLVFDQQVLTRRMISFS